MKQNNYLVGITGNIGSGKSTVCTIIESLGYSIVSADRKTKLAYEVAKEQLVEHFGNEIVGENGEILRATLSSIIFQDSEKRALLNSILHPIIIDLMFKSARSKEGIVFVEIPLLFECNLENQYNEIWLVVSDIDTKVQRIVNRDKLDENHAKNRLNSQMADDIKIEKSNIIIYNNGTLSDLENIVMEEIGKLEKRVEL